MYWLNRVWAGFLLVILSSGLQAAEVRNMYEVRLPVTDQNQDSRQAAFEQGLMDVMVRVSGTMNLPAINPDQAASYVQQYRYLQLEKSDSTASALPDQPVATHTLWIRYDETSINRLLRNNGLPIWGSQRPSVLIWLAVRDGRNRYILRNEDVSPIRDAVIEQAERRGLPLIWPAYDAKDSKLVQFADLWGGFLEPLIQASQRYGASAVLVGRMDWQKKDGWLINWTYIQDGRQDNWQQRAGELPVLMAAGINPVSNLLASRFAVVDNPSGLASLNILVNGVASAESYARVAGYLQSLTMVKHVYATDIMPGQAQFRLDVNGGEEELRRTIALQHILSPEAVVEPTLVPQPGVVPPQPEVAVPMLLRYRLN